MYRVPVPVGREQTGMVDNSDIGPKAGSGDIAPRSDRSGVDAWFVLEVLPLESALLHFLRRSWRNKSDVEDFCHDIYVRLYEAACREIPRPTKPFVFAVARNFLINRSRHQHVVAIEAVADLEALGIPLDEPAADRTLIARQDLYLFQKALEQLSPRCRQVVIMRKIQGLSRPEIAARTGIVESTVSEYLANGMAALTDIVLGETHELRRRP